MNVIVVSADHVVVQILVGWIVVVSLGSQGCQGGDKTYFQGTVWRGTHFIWVFKSTYVNNGTAKVTISTKFGPFVQRPRSEIWNESCGYLKFLFKSFHYYYV